MVRILENSLAFEFPAGWNAIKYDDTSWYRNNIQSIFKAMDILATDGTTHWWVEIKDFKNHQAENLNKFSEMPIEALVKTHAFIHENKWDDFIVAKTIKLTLTEDLLRKVIGTMAGVAAGFRNSNEDLTPYFPALTPKSNLRIVLLFTWDNREWGRLALRLSEKLNQKLKEIGLDCIVMNEHKQVAGLECIVTRLTQNQVT